MKNLCKFHDVSKIDFSYEMKLLSVGDMNIGYFFEVENDEILMMVAMNVVWGIFMGKLLNEVIENGLNCLESFKTTWEVA
jgi:hypothetical protein